MAAKTRDQLKSENASDFPDNTAGLISASDLRGQLDDIIDSATFPEDGGAGSGGITVDTGAPYRIIMLSDGTVKAIPVAAVPPSPPASLAISVGLTSVNLSWPIVTEAVKFYVYRDGALLDNNVVFQSFRDTTIVIGNTYEYRVSSVDQYNQVSPRSAAAFATIDASLNHAPTDVVITCWPNPLPTDGPALVRVNAHEIDVQNIAYLLNVDVGALRDTDDPSVWIVTI